jgi:hypothetical protein
MLSNVELMIKQGEERDELIFAGVAKILKGIYLQYHGRSVGRCSL